MVGWYFKNRWRADLTVASLAAACHTLPYVKALNIFETLRDASLRDVALAVFATSASLLGFVLAAATFLVVHIQNEAFLVLRKSRSLNAMHDLIGSAIWRLLALSAISLIVTVANQEAQRWLLMIMTFALVLSGLGVAALIWIVLKLLKIPIQRG